MPKLYKIRDGFSVQLVPGGPVVYGETIALEDADAALHAHKLEAASEDQVAAFDAAQAELAAAVAAADAQADADAIAAADEAARIAKDQAKAAAAEAKDVRDNAAQ